MSNTAVLCVCHTWGLFLTSHSPLDDWISVTIGIDDCSLF